MLTLALAAVCFGPGRPFKYRMAQQCLADGRWRTCPPQHAPTDLVYDVVIDSMYFSPFAQARRSGGLVLLEARTSTGDGVDAPALVRALSAAAPPEVRWQVPDLVQRFVRENAAPATLGRLLTVEARQRFLDSVAVERYFGPADSVGAPLEPGELVPRSGLLTLSRVAFDASGNWALAWAGRRDRAREGSAAYFLLHLDEGRWREVARVQG